MNNKYLLQFLLIILLIFICNSCQKDVVEISPKNLVGHWQWISTYKVIPTSATNPATPQNTGINELLVFNSNNTWYKTENAVLVDSGTYSLGHGKYINPSMSTFEYDSICYYQNKIKLKNGVDYYEIDLDTLVFSSSFADRWWSYTLSHSGTKRWVKK